MVTDFRKRRFTTWCYITLFASQQSTGPSDVICKDWTVPNESFGGIVATTTTLLLSMCHDLDWSGYGHDATNRGFLSWVYHFQIFHLPGILSTLNLCQVVP